MEHVHVFKDAPTDCGNKLLQLICVRCGNAIFNDEPEWPGEGLQPPRA